MVQPKFPIVEHCNLIQSFNWGKVFWRDLHQIWEYLEILHAIYGPKKAIDSLHTLVTENQKNNWFINGYLAGMYAELEQYDKALQVAQKLEQSINNVQIPKAQVVYADIYYKKQEYLLAKKYADQAVLLDSKNIDAIRLKTRIDQEIQAQKDSIVLE